VFVNGGTDFIVIPFQRCIGFPHGALERRKFDDHMGNQIAFGQTRRKLGVIHIFRQHLICDLFRESLHPHDLGMTCPQLGLIDHLFQILQPVQERSFAILLQEKVRIGEPGPKNPFMPPAHHGVVPGFGVVDRHEIGHEIPFVVVHRKILLVLPHGRNQDRIGQFQKGIFKIAADRRGILGQIGHRLNQFRIVRRNAAHTPAAAPSRLF
jgi:hypothetical protein